MGSTKILMETPWITLYESESGYYFVSRKTQPGYEFMSPDAVVIVPIHIDKDGTKRVVTILEYREPLGQKEFGFPAGLVDGGEIPLDTIRREMKEETGLDVTRILQLTPNIVSTAGLSDESVMVAYVECVGEVTSENQEECEDIETTMLLPEEIELVLANLNNEGTPIGAKAYMALAEISRHGLDWLFENVFELNER
jgi:ADP-ribose pyrophosphatase